MNLNKEHLNSLYTKLLKAYKRNEDLSLECSAMARQVLKEKKFIPILNEFDLIFPNTVINADYCLDEQVGCFSYGTKLFPCINQPPENLPKYPDRKFKTLNYKDFLDTVVLTVVGTSESFTIDDFIELIQYSRNLHSDIKEDKFKSYIENNAELRLFMKSLIKELSEILIYLCSQVFKSDSNTGLTCNGDFPLTHNDMWCMVNTDIPLMLYVRTFWQMKLRKKGKVILG